MKTTEKTETMSSELQTSCNKIRTLLSRQNRDDAQAKYDIGVEIVAVKKDEDKYGKGSVRVIADELGCTTVLLYTYAAVAAAWTPDEFKAICKKKNVKGVTLSFRHLLALAKADGDKRQALLEEMLTQCPPAQEMERKSRKSPAISSQHRVLVNVSKVAKLLARCETETASAELLAELEDAVKQSPDTKKTVDEMLATLDAQRAAMAARLMAPTSSDNITADTTGVAAE